MPRTPVPLVLAVLALAVAAPAPAVAAAPSVEGELTRLLDAGAITAEQRDGWRTTYRDAVALRKRLTGARRGELDAVVRTTSRLAARRKLVATRAPLVFATLQANRDWWASGPLLRYGQRVTVPGSRLVWQAYPGQGIQVQWLGSFGKANGLFLQGGRDEELRAMLDEALSFATQRAGGLGFESMFTFDGGAPPWVSAISQGTGVQALARAGTRLQEPRYLEAAHGALASFRLPPPDGVRSDDGHFLMYSFAPRLRILNGFAQALVGIFDLSVSADDPDATALFAEGDARLRRELADYDTGRWSLYRPGVEADLGYHLLQRDFLKNLCRRLTANPVADPAPYCAIAERFTGYTRTPPVVVARPGRLRAKRAGVLRLDLDKISTVTVTVRREGEVVLTRIARVGRGPRTFAITPKKAGPLEVTARAVDLAGNASEPSTATVEVLKARRSSRSRPPD